MSKLCKIYVLYDTITGNPFYIGSCVNNPKERLFSHINSDSSRLMQPGYLKAKSIYINLIRKLGGEIKVSVCIITSPELRDQFERIVYDYFYDNGCDLIQNKNYFNSSKKGCYGKKCKELPIKNYRQKNLSSLKKVS